MWAITKMPGNPITGRGEPLNEIGTAIQYSIAYLVKTAIIIVKERRSQYEREVKGKRLNK